MEMMPSKKKIELIDPQIIKDRREKEREAERTKYTGSRSNWSNNWVDNQKGSNDVPDYLL